MSCTRDVLVISWAAAPCKMGGVGPVHVWAEDVVSRVTCRRDTVRTLRDDIKRAQLVLLLRGFKRGPQPSGLQFPHELREEFSESLSGGSILMPRGQCLAHSETYILQCGCSSSKQG